MSEMWSFPQISYEVKVETKRKTINYRSVEQRGVHRGISKSAKMGRGFGSKAAEKYYREWATFEKGSEPCVKSPLKSLEAGRSMHP